jgi:hypothetical protein
MSFRGLFAPLTQRDKWWRTWSHEEFYLLLAACFMLFVVLFGLFFHVEGGGDMFLWNVCWLLPEYAALYLRHRCKNLQSSNITTCVMWKFLYVNPSRAAHEVPRLEGVVILIWFFCVWGQWKKCVATYLSSWYYTLSYHGNINRWNNSVEHRPWEADSRLFNRKLPEFYGTRKFITVLPNRAMQR